VAGDGRTEGRFGEREREVTAEEIQLGRDRKTKEPTMRRPTTRRPVRRIAEKGYVARIWLGRTFVFRAASSR